MAEERMPVLDALRKGEEAEHDPLREIVRWTVQELLEAEVAAQSGAGRYERNLERTTQRNGYRARAWDTRVGSLELQIPKLRQGSYFPSWLEPRRRAEQALVAGGGGAHEPGAGARGARGRRGVQLVISDAHPGLKRAITEGFVGAAGQRCRVHFMRNLLARVPKKAQAMVAAAVRPIFQQPDRTAAQRQLREVCKGLQAKFPHAVSLLEEAEAEIFTFYDFPTEHRRQIYSTNPLERLNKELKRRSAVVGIFPNRAAVIRLLGALLVEQNDEWLVGRHYFSELSMHKLLHPPPGTPIPMPLEAPAS